MFEGAQQKSLPKIGPGSFRLHVTGALAVAGKDLRIELRTREIVTTAGFFAALVASSPAWPSTEG
jgi:hypothetical protein